MVSDLGIETDSFKTAIFVSNLKMKGNAVPCHIGNVGHLGIKITTKLSSFPDCGFPVHSFCVSLLSLLPVSSLLNDFSCHQSNIDISCNYPAVAISIL